MRIYGKCEPVRLYFTDKLAFFLTMRACHTTLPIRHCAFSFMRFTIKSKPRKNIPGEKMESEVIQMENLTFYNGVQMPVEGFGVFF